ncbi:MAG: FAD-binding oxidoreductase [Longimicrobiales bacterium]|nr:FAD-binding oxidoreductase [Longimicrobiales bacterium]
MNDAATTTPAARDLRGLIRGPVFGPDDDGYDRARRAYNAMHDRRPAAVAQCVDAADVMAVVAYARDTGLALSVRGGNHSVPGYGTCDDGIVLDLSGIRYVRVDPRARRARIGGGALLGDLDHATHAFGLATPAGFISTTGVGGLTLGGGIGAYLSRKHGLTCDNLVSADVVTAEGEAVVASDEENPELFWALRGGGGNFGVVTAFEFELHPVREVHGGPIFFELDAAGDVLRSYRDYVGSTPREFGGFFAFQIAPPLPFIPEDRHGDTLCLVVTSWSGRPEEAEDVIGPVRGAGPVVAEHVGTMPYPALQSAFDALVPAGLRHYWKSDFVRELTDEAVDLHLEHGPRVPTMTSTMHIYPMDGAVQDVAADETAFGHRDADFSVNIAGMWADPDADQEHVSWVRDYYDAIHPHSGYEGGYTNFMAADDQERVKENYGPSYDRLARVKAAWDPDNLFRMNQNIEPEA